MVRTAAASSSALGGSTLDRHLNSLERGPLSTCVSTWPSPHAMVPFRACPSPLCHVCVCAQRASPPAGLELFNKFNPNRMQGAVARLWFIQQWCTRSVARSHTGVHTGASCSMAVLHHVFRPPRVASAKPPLLVFLHGANTLSLSLPVGWRRGFHQRATGVPATPKPVPSKQLTLTFNPPTACVPWWPAAALVYNEQRNGYYPSVYMNDFWLLSDKLVAVNASVPVLNLTLTMAPVSLMKWQMQVQVRQPSRCIGWLCRDE